MHVSSMTSQDIKGQTKDHKTSPACATICVGASLAHLTYHGQGDTAFATAFLGMSATANPLGRQIGPAERPPKLV